MSKLVKGFKWSAIERICTQLVQLLIMLILARLLGPNTYGLIGMITIVIAVSQTLVDSGFSSALIRKNDISDNYFNTAFVTNLTFSVVLYAIIYFFSPNISAYFDKPELVEILRVLSFVIIINSLCLVHKTKLTIKLDFKTQSKVTISAVVLSGFICITMAIYKPSVWVLVTYTLMNALISCLLYYYNSSWRPSFIFCKSSFYNLLSFSYKLVFASLLNIIFDNIYNVIIGRYYSAIDLGYFSQAKTLSVVPTNTFSTIIQRVTYRYFSQIRDDNSKLQEYFSLVMKNSCLIFFPMMMILSAYSDDIVVLLMGDKWREAGEILKYISLCYLFYPMHALNLNILNVFGRSDLFLGIEIVKKVLIASILFFTINDGVIAITIGMVLYSILATYINAFYTKRFINISFINQIKIFSPVLFITLLSSYVPIIFLSEYIGVYCSFFMSMFLIVILYLVFYKKEIIEISHGIIHVNGK